MAEGLVLLVIGMSAVFAFLVLLVITMYVCSSFFKKFHHLFPEEMTVPASAATGPSAAIAVALAAIRAKRG